MTASNPHRRDTPLHKTNPVEAPTVRFGARAEAYARARPDYPPAAIGAVLEGLGDPAALTVADIGAGTGISSNMLADRGCRVLAVEPNPRMQAHATHHDNVEWVTASGEKTGLEAASVDVVTCAQSFHWLYAPGALREFRRILRPGGRLALIWNVPDERDGFSAGYMRIMREFAREAPRSLWAMPETAASLKRSRTFRGLRVLRFDHAQSLTWDALIERARSASYTPREGVPLEQMHAALRVLFDTHAQGGAASLRYVTEAHIADLRTG